MSDEQVLKSELEPMTKDELKERLIVAEMVMKKLFQRNKELEESATTKGATSFQDVNSRMTNFIDTEDGNVITTAQTQEPNT